MIKHRGQFAHIAVEFFFWQLGVARIIAHS